MRVTAVIEQIGRAWMETREPGVEVSVTVGDKERYSRRGSNMIIGVPSPTTPENRKDSRMLVFSMVLFSIDKT